MMGANLGGNPASMVHKQFGLRCSRNMKYVKTMIVTVCQIERPLRGNQSRFDVTNLGMIRHIR